jgi:hypothetical protein
MMVLIDITALFLAASGGAAAAWLIGWLRASPVEMEPLTEQDSQVARETLSRLQDLTRRVAAEVDQHAECVEQVNAQLAHTDDNDEVAVLDAGGHRGPVLRKCLLHLLFRGVRLPFQKFNRQPNINPVGSANLGDPLENRPESGTMNDER